MATLNTRVALDMDNWNLGDPSDGWLGAANSHHFDLHAHGHTYDFGGHGFGYFGFGPFGVPVSGTVQSLTISSHGDTEFTLTGINIGVPGLYGFLAADSFDGLETYLFRNDDSITGSKYDDVLRGFTGEDQIAGGKGADSISGGLGADRMQGGDGADSVVFDTALDSSSVFYDRISDFDSAHDKFVFDDAITGVDAHIVDGRLSNRFFDVNLADATDHNHLLAHHAVLFTPDAGGHAGQTFLIVDLNGDAGYQIGEDAVIQLTDTSHLAGFGMGNFTT